MAFVDAALAVGTFVGADALGAGAATLIGGGLMGAGAGALFGGLTGGNIGQDALKGAGIGALGAGAASAMGAGAASAAVPEAVAGPAATTFAPEAGAAFTPEQLQAQMVAQDMGGGAAFTPAQYADQYAAQDVEGGLNAGTGTSYTSTGSPLTDGFKSALSWMGQHPGITAAGGLLGISALGGAKPTTFQTPGSQNTMNTGYFKLDPSKFQPTRMQPTSPLGGFKPTYPNYVANPYQPTQGYAQGGIASFSAGGDAMSKYRDYQDTAQMLNSYESMLTGQPAMGSSYAQQPVPSYISNPTIPADNQLIDANTKGMSPYDAAKYRLAQSYASAGAPTSAGIGLANRANPAYGQINTDPAMVQAAMAAQQQQVQGAAQGGIMGYAGGGQTEYSLGGYADGGNPRLLKGPGDGMSDNIPATIAGRQPARLADGEFVVPADVVSHLGNGSTDAGAKKLHGMMDKVRMSRTGKKKQAPQVKTDKFIPR
jgi:hypothetical protein